MFPLKDENPIEGKPYLTIILIVTNLAIFFFLFLSGKLDWAVQEYGMRPAEIMHGQRLHTLFTSMFLHGGFAHVIGNVWFLWIFGDNIEEICGRWRFLLLYFAAGVVAGLAHAFLYPDSAVPTIGASGAIAGALGAYMVTYPGARVYTLFFFFPFVRVIAVPAFLYLGIWFGLQFVSGSIALVVKVPVSTAYWAHIGGFVAGALLVPLLKRRQRAEDWALSGPLSGGWDVATAKVMPCPSSLGSLGDDEVAVRCDGGYLEVLVSGGSPSQGA